MPTKSHRVPAMYIPQPLKKRCEVPALPPLAQVSLQGEPRRALCKGTSEFPFYCYGTGASPSLNEVVFQYVQAAHHLGKDKHPVATSLQFWQQLVNQY